MSRNLSGYDIYNQTFIIKLSDSYIEIAIGIHSKTNVIYLVISYSYYWQDCLKMIVWYLISKDGCQKF